MTADRPLTWTSALGLSLPERTSDRRALRAVLVELWTWAYGPLGELVDDLEATRRYFDPARRGSSLRAALGNLNEPPGGNVTIDQSLAVALAQGVRLVTPEGRVAIELLADEQRAARVLAELARFYRTFSRHRLIQVARLLEGGGKPMQVPAVGLVLVLLVNGNTSQRRSVPRHRSGREREQIDSALNEVVHAFAESLAPSSRRRTTTERVFGGWALNEATRRLPEDVVVTATSLYVAGGRSKRVVRVLAAQLARRRRLKAPGVEKGFNALDDALKARHQELERLGIGHRSSDKVEQLRNQLLSAFADARERPGRDRLS